MFPGKHRLQDGIHRPDAAHSGVRTEIGECLPDGLYCRARILRHLDVKLGHAERIIGDREIYIGIGTAQNGGISGIFNDSNDLVKPAFQIFKMNAPAELDSFSKRITVEEVFSVSRLSNERPITMGNWSVSKYPGDTRLLPIKLYSSC